MRRRPALRFRPALERFEAKQLLSGGVFPHAHPLVQPHARAAPVLHLTLSRITQTSDGDAVDLVPPFPQVLVQARRPVPGRVYNVLSVAVRNHTRRTFTAADHLSVKLTGQSRSTPVLTGAEPWRPGQWIVFYVLTHQYYPVPPISGGFEFDLGGSRGVAIPGPSGIFLRLPYRPATFARTLDWIVAYGPGAEGGLGPRYGLPDTQIWQIEA